MDTPERIAAGIVLALVRPLRGLGIEIESRMSLQQDSGLNIPNRSDDRAVMVYATSRRTDAWEILVFNNPADCVPSVAQVIRLDQFDPHIHQGMDVYVPNGDGWYAVIRTAIISDEKYEALLGLCRDEVESIRIGF